MPEVKMNGMVTVSLDDQSKKAIDELNSRLEWAHPIVPIDDRENELLCRFREEAKTQNVSIGTVLLRRITDAENRPQQQGAGFSRQLKRIQELESLNASEKNKRNICEGRLTETARLLADARHELANIKAQNRTVCIRDMFVQVLPHQERNDRPTVPSEAAIRLQTRIDAEEFVEKLDALYDDPAAIAQLKYLLRWFENHSQVRKDLHARLPEFADALADCAVTNEGFAVLFGINLEPVFQEVHASNMRKKDGPIVNSKRMKPEGWQAPDVAGELRRQGWQPSSDANVDAPIPYKLGTYDSLFIDGKKVDGVATNVPVDVRIEGSTDGQNWCEVHGVTSVDGFPCGQCEDPRYPGNEIAALASLANALSPISFASIDFFGEVLRNEDTEIVVQFFDDEITTADLLRQKMHPRKELMSIGSGSRFGAELCSISQSSSNIPSRPFKFVLNFRRV
jgi:predicted HAD superfamily Cof-like phosphohydrolase